MRISVWAMGILVASQQLLACGESSDDEGGDDAGRGGTGTGGSTTAGGAGDSSGGSAMTGGSGGGAPANPLCETFATDYVRECPQNGTIGDARWFCEEGFAYYSPLGCEAAYGDLVVCMTEDTFECETGTVAGCDALIDAVTACAP